MHTHTHHSLFICSKDGYKFFLSSNNVVLSPGNQERLLPPDYFSKVVEVSSGQSHDLML